MILTPIQPCTIYEFMTMSTIQINGFDIIVDNCVGYILNKLTINGRFQFKL